MLPLDGARVPANRVELFLGSPGDRAITLTLIEPGELPVDVPLERSERRLGNEIIKISHLTPQRAFSPGSELRLSYRERCDVDGETEITHTYAITEPVEMPSKLGSLRVAEHTGVITIGGSGGLGQCVRSVETGYADLSVELSDEAKPYADLIYYELRVDGRPHSHYEDKSYAGPYLHPVWDSARGRGSDRIYAACGTELDLLPVDSREMWLERFAYLEPGAHQVQMVGIFPGGSELATDSVEVHLRCADEPDQVDAGSQPSRRRAAPRESNGCAALGGAGTNGSVWLVAALFGWLRSRRRIRSHPAP